jgi:hypothetical protein
MVSKGHFYRGEFQSQKTQLLERMRAAPSTGLLHRESWFKRAAPACNMDPETLEEPII